MTGRFHDYFCENCNNLPAIIDKRAEVLYHRAVLNNAVQFVRRGSRSDYLFITLNYKSRIPLCDQLCESVIRLVACGALAAGEKLPSVRLLAQDLGINPNTVQKAYRKLEQDEIIETVPGKGSFVSQQKEAKEQLRSSGLAALEKGIQTALDRGITLEEVAAHCAEYLQKKKEGNQND